MSKVDQLRALREAAATAASFPIKEVTAQPLPTAEGFSKAIGHLDERMATIGLRIDVAAATENFARLSAAVLPVPASTTYQYRDPDKRRAYMREYAKKRRALKAAERAANKEQGT